jgi:hypothetical protein
MYKICKKCKNLFWRNVKNCLKCKKQGLGNTLELFIPKKFKVLGSTTVYIPSKEHMKVPYNIVLLKDEYSHTQIKKTFKNLKIGTIIYDRKVNSNNFIACSKVKYIEEAGIKRLIKLVSSKISRKNISIEIDLSNCKQKASYELEYMMPFTSINTIITSLEDLKCETAFAENEFKDMINIKYPKIKNLLKVENKGLTFKIFSINNISTQKQKKNTAYFIDCRFYKTKNHIYKSNLLFITSNLDLFRKFIKTGKVNENLFYGEEPQIIFEELKNYE